MEENGNEITFIAVSGGLRVNALGMMIGNICIGNCD